LDSNEIDESDLHSEKHDEQRISTLRRIKIDSSDDSENINDSVRVNREFDSNESNLQCEKHDEQIIATLRGITID
jgi:hypothetical protein